MANRFPDQVLMEEMPDCFLQENRMIHFLDFDTFIKKTYIESLFYKGFRLLGF